MYKHMYTGMYKHIYTHTTHIVCLRIVGPLTEQNWRCELGWFSLGQSQMSFDL